MHVSGWAAASCLLPHTTVKSLCLLCSFWSVPCWWEGMEEPSLGAPEAIPPSTWASPRPVAASRCSLQPHGLSYLLLPPTILLVVFVLRDPNCVLIGSDKNQAEDIVLSLPWLPGLWPPHRNRDTDSHCCCPGTLLLPGPWLSSWPAQAVLQPEPPCCRTLPYWDSYCYWAFVLILFHQAAVSLFFLTAWVPSARPACCQVSDASLPSWLLFADCMSVFCFLYQVTDRGVEKAFMLWNLKC